MSTISTYPSGIEANKGCYCDSKESYFLKSNISTYPSGIEANNGSYGDLKEGACISCWTMLTYPKTDKVTHLEQGFNTP